ncbi:hypothetical protein HMPREF0290_2753, partial [Corynebacterium efficiens YS-314]
RMPQGPPGSQVPSVSPGSRELAAPDGSVPPPSARVGRPPRWARSSGWTGPRRRVPGCGVVVSYGSPARGPEGSE